MKILICCFILLSTTNIFTFENEFLKTCINIALKRDKRLTTRLEEIKLAERQLWATSRNFLPSLFLHRRASRGRTIREDYQAENLFLKLYQPLYEGGRLSAAHRYHSILLELAKLNYTKQKEDIIYEIKIAFYEYLSSVLEVEEIGKTLKELNSYYTKLENEFKAKAISSLELEEGKVFKRKVEAMYQISKKNKEIYEKRLIALVGIKSLDEIISPLPYEMYKTPPKEIDFTLDQLKNLLLINNIDLKKHKLNLRASEERKKIVIGRTYPRFYLEGTYGRSGEAFVHEPLTLATVWSAMLKCSWSFGGSSFESSLQSDRANPHHILDVSIKTENIILDTKIGLFDDMRYYVEKKETEVMKTSVEAEYEIMNKNLLLEIERFYNEYYCSLIQAKVFEDDLQLKKWRLEVLKKRNELYEVSTVDVMDGIFKVCESVLEYSKSLLRNYKAVSELERLVSTPLR